MPHGLDTDEQVCFYEQEFYPLSNFAAFQLVWRDIVFPTSEHAYQHEKFVNKDMLYRASLFPGYYRGLTSMDRFLSTPKDWIRCQIVCARSAHDAFKLAQENKDWVRPDWAEVRVPIMKRILEAKVIQHEYVRKKLLETGNRLLVENSWRDDFWGWGEDKSGKNMLGTLWMEVRDELNRSR